MKRINLLGAVLGGVLALAISAIPAYAAEGGFQRTLKVSGAVDLDVTTGSGNINIHTGAADTVQVTARIKAEHSWSGMTSEQRVQQLEQNPPIEQTGNIIRIGHIEDRELRNHVSISYDITVPVATSVRARTGSGDAQIDGVTGAVNSNTGSGNLKLTNIKAEVRAETGSGEILLEQVTGTTYANTGSGGIRANGISGAFRGNTGSGDVHLNETGKGDVEVSTGSGNAELRGVQGALRAETGSGDLNAEGTQQGEWRLHTGSGSVSVRLPASSAFDFYAETGSGGITVDHPLTITGSFKKERISGKVNGGGPLLDVRTGSGSIVVR